MGGVIRPQRPNYHYFVDDWDDVHHSIAACSRMPPHADMWVMAGRSHWHTLYAISPPPRRYVFSVKKEQPP